MMDRDDWLSPPAFVAGIDLSGTPNEAPAAAHIYWRRFRSGLPEEVKLLPQVPDPVVRYDVAQDKPVPVTQEWVNATEARMRDMHMEILLLKQHIAAGRSNAGDQPVDRLDVLFPQS